MVLISELLNLQYTKNITVAYYTEGPDHFDEWYALVKQKFPNIETIYCYENKLTSLKCLDPIKLFCYDNQLVSLECPNAIQIDCRRNKLTSLNCPNVKNVNCSENQLTNLECPNATQIYCCKNQLVTLECPNVISLNCSDNNLLQLNVPKAMFLTCNNNQLVYLECPKANSIICYNNPDLEFINSESFKYLAYDGNCIIPEKLIGVVRIENANFIKMSLDEIMEGIMNIRQKSTKSSRKI